MVADEASRALAPLSDDERLLLACLDVLDVPLWTAAPNKNYDKTDPKSGPEFWRFKGWQEASARDDANMARLGQFSPGDCICANGSYSVLFFDVDTKNGGDPEALRNELRKRGVTIYAEVETPSGGTHYYVASMFGMPSARIWHTPVLKAVDVQGRGRNVFVPGTIRRHYPGKGYQIVFNHLPDLIEARHRVDDQHAHNISLLGPIPPENPELREWINAKFACDEAHFAHRNAIGGADRLKEWLTEQVAIKDVGSGYRKTINWDRLPKMLGDALKHESMRGPVRTVRESPEGFRNDRLLWAGCTGVRDGWLQEEGDEGWEALADAASDCGLSDDEIETTLRSALATEGQL